MKKIIVSHEDELDFVQMERKIMENLTFDEIQEINDMLISSKKEYSKKKAKVNKVLINLVIIFLFGIAFSLVYGILLFIPFFIALIVLAYKAFVLFSDLKSEDATIGHLEYTKKVYFNIKTDEC